MRLGRPLGLCGLCFLLAAAGVQAQTDPFGRCEDRFAQAPDQWESARCFADAGRSERRPDEAARRLKLLRESHPDRLWLVLAQAYVEEDRDVRGASESYRQAVAAFVEAHHVEGEVRARHP